MTGTVTLTLPRLTHDGRPDPTPDGRRVVEIDLMRVLTDAAHLAAVQQAHEERAATVQHGSPEALEIWRYIPGSRELRASALKARVLAIDGARFDQSTSNADLRAMWSEYQWQQIEHAVDRLAVAQEGAAR